MLVHSVHTFQNARILIADKNIKNIKINEVLFKKENFNKSKKIKQYLTS